MNAQNRDPRIPSLQITCDHSGVLGRERDRENVYCCPECCPNWDVHSAHPDVTTLGSEGTVRLHRELAHGKSGGVR